GMKQQSVVFELGELDLAADTTTAVDIGLTLPIPHRDHLLPSATTTRRTNSSSVAPRPRPGKAFKRLSRAKSIACFRRQRRWAEQYRRSVVGPCCGSCGAVLFGRMSLPAVPSGASFSAEFRRRSSRLAALLRCAIARLSCVGGP